MDTEFTDEMKIKDESDFQKKLEIIKRNFDERLKKVERKYGFVRDLMALFSFMTDSAVHWSRKAVVVGALLYFVIPFDTIPDVAPVVGFLDDIGVVALAVKYLGDQLREYYV